MREHFRNSVALYPISLPLSGIVGGQRKHKNELEENEVRKYITIN